MIIKKLKNVPVIKMHGSESVKKQIVIGPDDGSNEIVLRYFSIEPGRNQSASRARLSAFGEN